MSAVQRDTSDVPFEVEARLLQELGERLVASPDVALLELIKNASDADAPECRVILSSRFGKPVLVIADDGLGMSEDDFRTRWMRIAADSKRDPLTKRFNRPVTGQKGIGRFAIRYLGGALKLESVSDDARTGERRKIEAVFDWRRLDQRASLEDARVKFGVSTVKRDHPTGTRLIVSRLKAELREAVDKTLLTSVLQIVSPISALDAGPFEKKRGKTTVVDAMAEPSGAATEARQVDPGFKVTFVGFPKVEDGGAGDLASTVIANAWARLTIALTAKDLVYTVRFKGEPTPSTLHIKRYSHTISRGLYGDIIFAPKRKNSFVDVGPDGREIWRWIRRNSGVGVVDNGFRIRPYGFKDDDWLYLNQDGAHNKREWRSHIATEEFPLSEVEQARPKLNPALNLAASFQVIGVINVASRASNDPAESDLVPSMDREGFLNNTAYRQMVDVVRGGLEFLAKVDKDRQLRLEEERAIASRDGLRADLSEVIDEIRKDPRLATEEKTALVEHYSSLAKRVVEQEDYDRAARQRLEIAAGLGVVAGFMTHEAERLFLALDSIIQKLSKRLPSTANERAELDEVIRAREQLDSYIRYTRLYTDSLRSSQAKPFSALGQIEWVCESFGATADSRGIVTEIDCATDVMAPAVPIAMYSAVLLNLYTNAIKAVIARETDGVESRILISAWNDQKQHHLQVQDSGIGIPAASQKRIWDPFFTTTSRVNSPLGTGMGLGLSLVRDLVERQGGRAQLAAASHGFTTCVHVSLPRNLNVH